LDRAKISKLIFKKPLLKKGLEDIVHPLVWEMMLNRLSELKDSPLVIIDVPLLFEAQLNSLFSPIILCFCPPDLQYKRLRDRDPQKGRWLSKRIIKSQMPISEKIRLSNFIINNNGSFSQLIRQTKEIWLNLKN
jgi:dephospho-CoA kinase